MLSDLHAHSEEPDPGGAQSLSFHGSGAAVEKLFAGVSTALADVSIDRIDAVICSGDLANKCDTTALPLIWARLSRLADDLSAPLIATAGNHDHARTGGDPKSFLKLLRPHFPTRDQPAFLSYFAQDFARTSVAGHTVITLNSSALAGYQAADGTDEYKHGRVSRDTVAAIQTELRSTPPEGVRVLVVHHHPVQLPQIDLNEASKIIEAELLLEALADDGRWLIIHGHKHRPWIQYAPGGGGSAVLFSAGSFAAQLNGVLAQSTKNQFYVIELLTDDEAHELGLGVAGIFRAWTLSPIELSVWVDSGRNDGLPAVGGFGWRADPYRLARQLDELAQAEQREITWSKLVDREPRLPFLSPDDWKRVDQQLGRNFSETKIEWDAEGRLIHVAHLPVAST